MLFIGPLTFDNYKRDAIDETDNIRSALLMAALPLDLEFSCHMEDVVKRFLPIDVFQLRTPQLPIQLLLKTFSKR